MTHHKRPFHTITEAMKAKMQELRIRGWTRRMIAKEVGVSLGAVDAHSISPRQLIIRCPEITLPVIVEAPQVTKAVYEPSTFIRPPSKARLMAGR